MEYPSSFLSISEDETYQNKGRRIKRSIISSPIHKPEEQFGETRILENFFLEQLQSLVKRDHKWFSCNFVEVIESDGCSWSAQSVYGKIIERYGDRFKPLCFNDRMDT